ncbi:transposase [Mesorhizobium sp. L-2-11]|nr:transposase [Mesorhizobium sp. L-2-11]
MGAPWHGARQPADQRYQSAYLFGAICTARGKGAAMALPFADTAAMQLHLDEISRHVGARRAGRAATRPGRLAHNRQAEGAEKHHAGAAAVASPRTQPGRERLAISAPRLSNRVFDGHNAIIDAACEAWQKLIARPETITSIGMREWAHVGRAS